MAKYNIGGRIVESESPLTDEEIDEIAGSFSAPAPSPQFQAAITSAENLRNTPVTSGQYFENSARLAPVSGISSTYGLVRSALDLAGIDPTTSPIEKITNAFTRITQPRSVLDRVADNPLLGITTSSDILRGNKVNPLGGLLSNMQPYQSDLLNALAPLTGGNPNMAAPDLTTKVIGAGIQTALDPTALLAGGVPRSVGQLARRPVPLGFIGATADAGGELGGSIEQTLTGEETGAGRAISSIVTGGVTAAKGGVVAETVKTGTKGVGQLYSKYKEIKADPDAAEQAMATGAAKRFLKKIAEGKSEDQINALMDDFSKISNKITGEDFPLAVSMADNPTLRSTVANLVKTNPEFRLRYEAEMAKIGNAIDKNAEGIFGSRYTAVEGVEQVSIKNAVKVRQNIDTELESISNRLIGSEVDGARVQKLVESRVSTARAEQSGDYKSVTDDARKAGAKLPKEGVRDIYNFIQQNKMRDIFGIGTDLDKRIISNFAPDGTGFSPVNFDTVVSLKSEINRLQRGRLEPKEARLLVELENTVNQARESIPGNYNERLKAVDRAYYEKVGVPFSAQGIKDIDSRKYAEQVAPVIVKNQSSFNQFRAAVGEEANVIGRNAILSEAYAKTVKDGAINPNALRGYLKSKEKVIDEIPGLKDELNSALVDDRVLKLHRDTLDQNLIASQKRLADNFIVNSIDPETGTAFPSYDRIVNSMIDSQRNIVTVRNNLKDVDPATSKAVYRSLQAEFLGKARDSADGGAAFIKDPKNSATVNFLFGRDTKEGVASFKQAMDNIVKLSDRLNEADITKINIQVKQKDLDSVGNFLEQQGLPGLDAPYIASTVRDRISSLFQKGVRIASRVNQARTKDATEAMLADVILDPKGRQKLQAVVNDIDLTFKNPASVNSFINTMTDLFPRYMYGVMSATTNEPPAGAPLDVQFGGFEDE
jgi:hypothetical protein